MKKRRLFIVAGVSVAVGIIGYVLVSRLITPARSGPMTRLERSGLVIRRSCGSMETFVNPTVWSGMRPNDQQQAAQALGAYCAEQGSVGEMTIIEDQTRRKIAHWNGTTLQRF
jgi:hypothetical protein